MIKTNLLLYKTVPSSSSSKQTSMIKTDSYHNKTSSSSSNQRNNNNLIILLPSNSRTHLITHRWTRVLPRNKTGQLTRSTSRIQSRVSSSARPTYNRGSLWRSSVKHKSRGKRSTLAISLLNRGYSGITVHRTGQRVQSWYT